MTSYQETWLRVVRAARALRSERAASRPGSSRSRSTWRATGTGGRRPSRSIPSARPTLAAPDGDRAGARPGSTSRACSPRCPRRSARSSSCATSTTSARRRWPTILGCSARHREESSAPRDGALVALASDATRARSTMTAAATTSARARSSAAARRRRRRRTSRACAACAARGAGARSLARIAVRAAARRRRPALAARVLAAARRCSRAPTRHAARRAARARRRRRAPAAPAHRDGRRLGAAGALRRSSRGSCRRPLSFYLVVNYAAVLALLGALTYGAIPLLAERQARGRLRGCSMDELDTKRCPVLRGDDPRRGAQVPLLRQPREHARALTRTWYRVAPRRRWSPASAPASPSSSASR